MQALIHVRNVLIPTINADSGKKLTAITGGADLGVGGRSKRHDPWAGVAGEGGVRGASHSIKLIAVGIYIFFE